jgi:type IV secretory pathway VirB3-like protein
MSVVALVHLAFLSVYPPTTTSIWWRTRALSIYVVGFMYVAVLEVTTFGFDNLLWVNEFGIALIAAVLHLNLKVRSPHAD